MRLLLLAIVALLLASAPRDGAQASCNSVPEKPPIFLGARGSIDRPFVGPDPDESVNLRPDFGSEKLSARALRPTALLVTIIFKPPAAAASTFFIAGDNDCRSLEEPVCFLERLFCHVPRTCLTGEAAGLDLTTDSQGPKISFRFPGAGSAGPVTVAVTTRPNPEERNLPPLGLQTETCDAFIARGKGSNLIACIDTLRTLPDADPPGDPTFAQLVALPPSYDYRTACTQSVGGDPTCLGTATDIAYTVNSDGDILMPIRWQNILRPKGGGLDQRQLLASTAVEAVSGQGNRIFIPSGVFLETTSQQGTGFTPSPAFFSEELSDRPYEQTVAGTADEGKSVLKFGRRKLWDHACNGGATPSQACEADVDCAPGTCASTTPGYFACDGGDRFRLPCTQTAQCPQGACRPVSDTGSVCVLVDGTWTKVTCKQDSDCGATCKKVGTASGSAAGTGVCIASDGTPTGAACKQDGDCGKCGPGLFEFRGRTNKGLGTLKRIAINVRGVCDSGLLQGNSCMDSSTCGSSAHCVTYRAAALSYTTAASSTAP